MSKTNDNKELKSILDEGTKIYKSGNLKKAFEIFDQIAKDYPDDPESVFNCGVIFDKQGNKQKALEKMREALKRDKNYHKASLNLAALLFETKKYEEAAIITVKKIKENIPQWIRTRFENLHLQMLQVALSNIAKLTDKIANGLITGVIINDFKKYITVLTGKKYEYCDLVFTSDGQAQYFLKSKDDHFIATIEQGHLIVKSEILGKLYDFILPGFIDNGNQNSKKQNLQNWRKEYTIDDLDETAKKNEQFLIDVKKICDELKKEPDQLFYVYGAWGDWEEPVDFSIAKWKEIWKEITTQPTYYFQINFDLSIGINNIYGRYTASRGVWMEITGTNDFIEKIKKIIA